MMAASVPVFPERENPDWDAEVADMADWALRSSSKTAIDRAGLSLVDWWRTPSGTPFPPGMWVVTENWRNCHGLPLSRVRRDLRARMRQLEMKGIVAYRLKRFVSVLMKLVREPTMKLSQMQDLGGCRAILNSIEDVNRLYDSYRSVNASQYIRRQDNRYFDYLSDPKEDGYRGIHVVCRFSAYRNTYNPWDGQRIEIQIRTKLQHAFATAVETVTTFSSSPLKFGAGPKDWRRFFSLVGSAFAFQERTALVPKTPTNYEALVGEIRLYARRLDVRRKLEHWREMLRAAPQVDTKGFSWLLLSLNLKDNTVSVTGFKENELARNAIAEREKAIAAGAQEDAVLVSVNSLGELRAAYPNYYGDTRRFLKALKAVTSERFARRARL